MKPTAITNQTAVRHMSSKSGAGANSFLDTALLSLGAMLENMGQMDFATKVYDIAISLNAKCTPAIANKIVIMINANEDDQAMKELNKLCARSPKDQYLLRTRGFAYLLKGDFDNAYKDFKKALENNEWDGYTVLMAYPVLQKYNPSDAVQVLTDAIENNKLANQNWPYPIIQCLRGDIPMTDLLPQASTPARLLEARAHFGFIKAHSDDSQAGKADCLYVFNKSGTAHVRLMASRGLKVIQQGYADKLSTSREKADRIQGMDFMD